MPSGHFHLRLRSKLNLLSRAKQLGNLKEKPHQIDEVFLFQMVINVLGTMTYITMSSKNAIHSSNLDAR